MGVPLLMVRMKDKENGGEQVSGELTGQKIVGGDLSFEFAWPPEILCGKFDFQCTDI